jgi:hypothetical protein
MHNALYTFRQERSLRDLWGWGQNNASVIAITFCAVTVALMGLAILDVTCVFHRH